MALLLAPSFAAALLPCDGRSAHYLRPIAPPRARVPLLASGKTLRWASTAREALMCDSKLSGFLAEIAADADPESVLLPVKSESVEGYTSLGDGMYRARTFPLRLPGITVTPTALVRVESLPASLRYTTEQVRTEFAGPFRDALNKLQAPDITACTVVSASDEGMLSMETEFSMVVPLPGWWPLSDGAGAASAGNALISDIVRRDTIKAVARIKAAYAARQSELRAAAPVD